jgi:hypothetical protein
MFINRAPYDCNVDKIALAVTAKCMPTQTYRDEGHLKRSKG